MQFPMFVVSVQQLLKMTEVRPHEILKDEGIAVEYEESMGKAAFISHEWVGDGHPDPEFKQLSVFQDALTYMMSDLEQIPADVYTEVHCKKKPVSTSAFRTQALCVWYDYFCCPQLGRQPSLSHSDSDLSMAVTSIPAYVAKCSFFFALCPVIVSEELGRVFSPQTWAERGWCRMASGLFSLRLFLNLTGNLLEGLACSDFRMGSESSLGKNVPRSFEERRLVHDQELCRNRTRGVLRRHRWGSAWFWQIYGRQ